jgi:hypothetical protein
MPSQTEIAKYWGVSQPYVAKLVKKGCPTHSLRAATVWRDANARQRAPTHAKGNCNFAVVKLGRGRRTRQPREPSNTGNSLEDARCDAITMNQCAFALFEEAMAAGDDERLPRYMRIYLTSHQLRMKAERMAREEMERRGVLVNKQLAFEHCRRCLDAVLKRLRRLPQESGPQCNPQDPHMAFTILQRAVDEILLAGQAALTDLA